MEQAEIWKACVGWPEYEVSDQGVVRRLIGRGGSPKGKVLNGQVSWAGYRGVWLCDGINKPCHRMVHRLVWEAFRGLIPEDKQINHLNGDKIDNRLENLEVVTAKENTAHAFKTGLKRIRWAEESQGAKLTNEQVIEIRKLLLANVAQTKIAEMFGVTQGTIGHINRGNNWTTVPELADEVAARHAKHTHNAKTKLTAEQARQIKRMAIDGVSHHVIASQFGITPSHVSFIQNGQRWSKETKEVV